MEKSFEFKYNQYVYESVPKYCSSQCKIHEGDYCCRCALTGARSLAYITQSYINQFLCNSKQISGCLFDFRKKRVKCKCQEEKENVCYFNDENKKYLSKNWKQIIFHFLDFDFAYFCKTDTKPIEIGICSFNLLQFKQKCYLNDFIKVGDYDPSMKNFINKCGIDPRSTSLKKKEEIKAKIMKYFEQFYSIDNKIVIIIRDKELGLCYYGLKTIMGTIPDNYIIITHVELQQTICQSERIVMDKILLTNIADYYHQNVMKSRRCDHHSSMKKEYLCALESSRKTVTSIMCFLKNVGIKIEGQQILPDIPKTVLKIDMRKSTFLIVFTSSYCGNEISEILLMRFKCNKDKLQVIESVCYYFPSIDNKQTIAIKLDDNNLKVQCDITKLKKKGRL